ncbi:MAG: hypothetical protein DSZ31_06335, partial [Gammaproteobacteria bacterium]
MQLLNEEVKNQIREIFNKEVPNPVKVVLFTRAFGCETCEYAERLLKEIEETVPEKFKAEVVSSAIPEGQEKAKEYGLDPDRVPAIVILDKDGKDRGIHYIGLPAGLEFSTFINGIALASKGEVELDEKGKEIVEQIKQPLLRRRGIDDAVGAIAVHGGAGVWSMLAMGLFGYLAYLDSLWYLLALLVFVPGGLAFALGYRGRRRVEVRITVLLFFFF